MVACYAAIVHSHSEDTAEPPVKQKGRSCGWCHIGGWRLHENKAGSEAPPSPQHGQATSGKAPLLPDPWFPNYRMGTSSGCPGGWRALSAGWASGCLGDNNDLTPLATGRNWAQPCPRGHCLPPRPHWLPSPPLWYLLPEPHPPHPCCRPRAPSCLGQGVWSSGVLTEGSLTEGPAWPLGIWLLPDPHTRLLESGTRSA